MRMRLRPPFEPSENIHETNVIPLSAVVIVSFMRRCYVQSSVLNVARLLGRCGEIFPVSFFFRSLMRPSLTVLSIFRITTRQAPACVGPSDD
jgi:hypothetical protein